MRMFTLIGPGFRGFTLSLFVGALTLPAVGLGCGTAERRRPNVDSSDGGAGGVDGQGGQGGAGGGVGGQGGAGGGGGSSSAGGSAACDDTTPVNETLAGSTDPEAGDFTMAEALAGLGDGPGPLRAVIDTELGTVTCELFPNEAPIGTANFIGLARGARPWKDPLTKKWVKRRYYDGLIFHRVISSFVIQGGDPLGTGFGGPGYKFINESSSKSHVAGTLAYANAGVDTNGSQFYITDSPHPELDGGYTIFGLCSPIAVIAAIASVPTDAKDKPLTPVHMQKVTITRCAPAPTP